MHDNAAAKSQLCVLNLQKRSTKVDGHPDCCWSSCCLCAFRYDGSVVQLGVGNAILVIVQLCFAAIIVICLDELLQKGYGLG
ncbi:hypothetical protein ACFX1S_036850 [Malus domestica]